MRCFSRLCRTYSLAFPPLPVFEPYKDSRVDTVAPKLVFIALNLAAMGLGVWKVTSYLVFSDDCSSFSSNLNFDGSLMR